MTPNIARVALPVPLDKLFDYLIKPGQSPVIGGRVKVPFGPKQLIGIVISLTDKSDFPLGQLKAINTVLDSEPLWHPPLFGLLSWASTYYQYPLGDTLANAMPTLLRKGREAAPSSLKMWQITEAGRDQPLAALSRAPRQAQVLNTLRHGKSSHESLLAEEVSSAILKTLSDKGWIEALEEIPDQKNWQRDFTVTEEKPKLNDEQALAVATVNANPAFGCYLLEGVTGSGKTEVYLNLLEPVLAAGKQALILVPEIGLTPQTINRFRRRFNVPLETVHSGLNDTERLSSWLAGRDNQAGIIIGTRSALFTPFDNLGIIIVDEEHDASYKQQDSLRYHARDLAVMRANRENIPVILGSATPGPGKPPQCQNR